MSVWVSLYTHQAGCVGVGVCTGMSVWVSLYTHQAGGVKPVHLCLSYQRQPSFHNSDKASLFLISNLSFFLSSWQKKLSLSHIQCLGNPLMTSHRPFLSIFFLIPCFGFYLEDFFASVLVIFFLPVTPAPPPPHLHIFLIAVNSDRTFSMATGPSWH